MTPLDRRSALGLLGVAAATPAVGGAAGASGRLDSHFLDLDPQAAFKAHFRLERDLRPQGQALTWYHFTSYIAEEGKRPQPVVRYEGMEFSYFRRIAPDAWLIHAHNLSYPRSIESGSFIDSVRNPATSALVKVPSMVLLDDPGVVYGPKGYLATTSKTGTWRESHRVFRVQGDTVVVDHIRPAPESWPGVFMEASTQWVAKRAFHDPRITSLMCGVSGFYTFPFPAWLEMGERKGRMIASWFGEKIPSVDRLPVEFFARTQREHPELLKPRLERLDFALAPAAAAAVAALR